MTGFPNPHPPVRCKVSEQDRDPRVDPMPGDVLRKRNVDYTVDYDSQICFCITKRQFGRHGVRTDGYGHADDWRKWAATATVVRRGDA